MPGNHVPGIGVNQKLSQKLKNTNYSHSIVPVGFGVRS